MFLATSVLSWYTFGSADATPTPPTPPVGVVGTQTFPGFGGGFLGPHHKRKREQLYANAQLFGPPPVYRFNRRDLLPALVFDLPPEEDPLLRKAMAEGIRPDIKPGFPIQGLAQLKIKGLNEYYARKKKKRQQQEEEMMLL